MLNLLKKLLLFRVGQKSTRGAARILGFGRLGTLIGIAGGIRAARRRRHA